MGSSLSKSPEAKAEDLVAHTVRDNKVVIFSKRSCGFCDAAKHTLRSETARLARKGCTVPPAAIVELDDVKTVAPDVAHATQARLAELTGAATVPRVFINGKFVGGASETAAYARDGGLRLALMQAGACQPS